MTDPAYLSGFGNHFATEAVPGALPEGRNSPQRPAFGLYAEQLSGTALPAPPPDTSRPPPHPAAPPSASLPSSFPAPPSPRRATRTGAPGSIACGPAPSTLPTSLMKRHRPSPPLRR